MKDYIKKLAKRNYSLKQRPLLLLNKHVNRLIQIIEKEPNTEQLQKTEFTHTEYQAAKNREIHIADLKYHLSIVNGNDVVGDPPLQRYIFSPSSVAVIYKTQYASLK